MGGHGQFVQHIRFKSDKIDDLIKLSEEWNFDDAPGNPSSWILRDRENPGSYVVSVVFSSYDEAMKNNVRPETQEFAARMQELCTDIQFGNYDLIHES